MFVQYFICHIIACTCKRAKRAHTKVVHNIVYTDYKIMIVYQLYQDIILQSKTTNTYQSLQCKHFAQYKARETLSVYYKN